MSAIFCTNTHLYEKGYPEPHHETPSMCRRIFERYLHSPPTSIFDIGCGTGRDLNSLSRTAPDCVGIDALTEMIDYARARYPHIQFDVGEMRTVRVQRLFDVILCMGCALMYALTNPDIDSTISTFAAQRTQRDTVDPGHQ